MRALSSATFGLSSFQQVLEASRFGPAQGLNVEQMVCTTSEVLNLEAFRKSWQRVFDRHPALRVDFSRDEKQQARQRIHSRLELPVSVEDRPEIKAPEREAFLDSWLEQDRTRNFDLSAAPLMRISVIIFAPEATTWVWTFHHILLDGRSIPLVLEDFFACYEAECAGRAPVLPERAPFTEFIAWQESWMATHGRAAESFWRELVTNDDHSPALSISLASVPVHRRQQRLRMNPEPATTENLHRLAKKFDLTVNSIVQGVWALLLRHYYGSKSVTFAAVRACRRGSIEGAEGVVGLLMNLLPVHACIAEEMPALDLVKSIRQQQLAAREFQWTPWETIRQSLPVGASKQYSDSCVLFERYDIAQELTERFGMEGRRHFALRERANIPLLLSVSERPQIQFELSYQSALFYADDIARLGDRFLDLLHNLLQSPTASVSDLMRSNFGDEIPSSGDRLSPIEQERRHRYNATAAPVPAGLLHSGFFAMARKQPTQIAIDDPGRTVSYGELAGHAHGVARRLRKAGVGQGKLVAVVMEKGWEQIAAVLGILRAGAAYLPVDPELPATRLEYLLSNGQVAVALTQGHLRTTIAWPSALQVWDVDQKADSADACDGPEPSPDSLAYVIYTSGSTGVPKGVMIAHRAALNTIADINRRLEISAGDRILALSALSFDLSVYDIFGILGCGGSVVLPAPESARDPRHWVGRMKTGGVTIWNSVPALMQMLVTALDSSPEDTLLSLRWAMLSGDWIPVDLPGRLRRFVPACRVMSLGGATEASIWSIAYPIEKVDPAWTSIPYGVPLANQRVHVLDGNFQPCPEGAAGELYLAGEGLAIGYLEDEAKTAERFVRSPVTNERLYRTGDYGRFRPEGFVEFLGRKDTQVKIRGYRIEMGEIEAALLRLSGVRESAALNYSTDPSDRSGGTLVGCVVFDRPGPASIAGPAIDEDKVRAGLAELLPAHMIPTRIFALEQMPLNANGKLDRAALREKVRPLLGLEDSQPRDEPEDLLERAIWRIWQDILPGRHIGRSDRFYEVGGDSLTVLQMIMRVERIVGRPIGLRPLQQGGTIVDIAAAARESGPLSPPPRIICVQRGGSKSPLFFAHGDLENGGLYCQRLAPRLGADQPLQVISPHGAFGEDSPSTFEDIAASFVELIRSVQPHGPYYLGGFCNGAVAMYEAAQQLTRAGEKVPSLILLDPPDLYLFLSRRKVTRLGRLIGLRARRGRNNYQRIAEGIEIWHDHGPIRFFRDFWTRSLTWTMKPSKAAVQQAAPPSAQTDLNIIYYDAMVNYEPKPYAGDAWVILREGESHRHPKQISYWGALIPAVRFEKVPGTHLELRDNMDEIAAIMKTAVANSGSD